jgi:hypothetical protein
MIVFFKASKLIKQLQEDSVPEHEKLFYFLLFIIVTNLVNQSSYDVFDLVTMKVGTPLFNTSLYLLVSNLTICIVGSYLIWRVNREGDGKNFFERYWCLQVPVSMWTSIVGLVSYIIFAVVGWALNPAAVISEASIPAALWLNLIYIFEFRLFYIWMKKVSHKN